MFKNTDPYTFTKHCDLYLKDVDSFEQIIGQVYMEYRVARFDNLRMRDASAVNSSNDRQFVVECVQRINIWNRTGMVTRPEKTIAYENYPVFLQTLLKTIEIPGVEAELLEYSPQTVNTQVNTSSNAGTTDGSHTGTTSSQTSGASHTGTNSYDITVNREVHANISPEGGPSIGTSSGISGHYGYMTADTTEHSSTYGREFGTNRSRENSSAVSMSMKDWGAYAMVDPTVKSPVWSFGQEYPWDIFNCRKSTGEVQNEQERINLPDSVALRLYSEGNLYPPSQLSMYGINFIVKAKWLFSLDPDQDTIDMQHFLTLLKASHETVTVTVDGKQQQELALYVDRNASAPYVGEGQSLKTSLDLSLMAMDPIGAIRNSAIIGFVPNKFIVKPSPVQEGAPATPMKILASANNMLIKDTTDYSEEYTAGTGFKASMTALNASLQDREHPLELTLYFKVADTSDDYTLFLKHWKLDRDIRLTFTINGDEENSIVKYVDALEAEGGENNILAIALRDLNYASVNYHDYLKLGLNAIRVKIQPEDDKASAYQVRAISIEKS